MFFLVVFKRTGRIGQKKKQTNETDKPEVIYKANRQKKKTGWKQLRFCLKTEGNRVIEFPFPTKCNDITTKTLQNKG